jgi:hypothetical protein
MTSFFIPRGLRVRDTDSSASGIVSTLVVTDGTLTITDSTATLSVPRITSGTAAPSGGNDGDIYLQFTP